MILVDPASWLGRRAAVWLALAVGTGCSAHTKYPRSPSTAFGEHQATALGRLFAPAEAEHPGESGVGYLRYGRKALDARLALADLAERSLDLQYYIWDADVSGRRLADRIIRAADRGVRVRVLLDDHGVVDRDTAIAQLSAHRPERKTTASFFYADHYNLDTAVLRATLFCAVIGDRLGFARTADLKLFGIGPETYQIIADRFRTLQRKRRVVVWLTHVVGVASDHHLVGAAQLFFRLFAVLFDLLLPLRLQI